MGHIPARQDISALLWGWSLGTAFFHAFWRLIVSQVSQLIIGPADPIRMRVEALLRAPLVEAGFELVEVEFSGTGEQGATLTLYVDREGGISLDACADASRLAGAILDVEDPVSSAYRLEVSSPGLDRRVANRADLEATVGQRVRAKTVRSTGRKAVTGVLEKVVEGRLTIDEDGAPITLDGRQIRILNRIHDFGERP
mgnify:CR=1 FL=1